MNCKLLILASFVFLTNASSFALKAPMGDFLCPIEVTEYGGVSIAPGVDFLNFVTWDKPKTRKADLKVTVNNIKLVVSNPQVLPNWLEISEDKYDDQVSWALGYEDKVSYSVVWDYAGYFGSSLLFDVTGVQEDSFSTDIELDDNDGFGTSLKAVKCTRI